MFKKENSLKMLLVFIHLIFFLLSSFIFAEVEKDLLDMTLEELMNVKITTAARTPEKIGDIPASVVLITRKEIETYGYRTLAEILENIPGLYYIDDYGQEGKNFGVRGFWSGVANDNMIILVNGDSQVDDSQSNYHLSKINVPVEAIERIEVIRGPMSVIYGNGAFYGVINIFTNDFSKEKSYQVNTDNPMNSLTFLIGTKKTKKIFVRSAGIEGDFRYVFNASLYDTYGMDHPLKDMVRDPAILPIFGILSEAPSTSGRLENNEKYLDFSGTFKSLYINLNYNESDSDSYYYIPSYEDGSRFRTNSINMSLGYRKKLSNIFSVDGKITYSKNDAKAKYDYLFPDFYGIQNIESKAFEADLNCFIYPFANIEIKTGLLYRSILDVSNMYDLPSFFSTSLQNNYFYLSDGNDIITQAFYTQLNYLLFSNLTLVAGIRLEQMPKYSLGAILAGGTEDFMKIESTYNQDEIEIIPRFAAIYALNENHIFKFLYGQAINRPSFFQNTTNLLLEPGKGFLKPESIQTIEINYISSFSSNFTLNISVFRNTLENLITRVSESDNSGNYSTWSANAGKMITYGTELTLNTEPFENFRLELSGTFQETEDKRPGFENIDVAYSPKLLGYVKASYRRKGFTIALNGNYVGAMETFWDVLTSSRIGDRVDGYFLIGANFRLENIFLKGLFFNLKCSNLLDEQIRYPTFTNNDWATKGTIGLRRTILATIGLKF